MFTGRLQKEQQRMTVKLDLSKKNFTPLNKVPPRYQAPEPSVEEFKESETFEIEIEALSIISCNTRDMCTNLYCVVHFSSGSFLHTDGQAE